MKDRFRLLPHFLLALLLLGIMLPKLAFAAGAERQPRLVRVGFPNQPGLSEIDANGEYSGYNYDYLKEIAQYTGWEYEFVQVPGDLNESLGTMLGMLEKGELDIMGSMSYSPELAQPFGYPGTSCGMAHTALIIREDNTELNGNNYPTY